jgi:hypothetical protein
MDNDGHAENCEGREQLETNRSAWPKAINQPISLHLKKVKTSNLAAIFHSH